MNEIFKTAAVMPNFTEYGISVKEVRGVVADAGNVPAPLVGVQGALHRLASKMRVDLTQPSAAIRQSFETALSAKPVGASSIACDRGLSPN